MLAMGEGMVFLGQLDANVVALDIKTGKEVWKTPIEDLARTATASPARRSIMTASSTAGSPAANMACAAA